MSRLLLPGDPGFYEILHSKLPPGWIDRVGGDFANAFAARAGSQLLEPMTQQELEDYLYGGEYDELEDDGTSDTAY